MNDGQSAPPLAPHVRAAAERAGDPTDALIRALSGLGPRPHGSAAQRSARALLSDALRDTGARPYLGDGFAVHHPGGGTNLLAVVPGQERRLRPLLLTTHYDGPAESPGAGDNGAAVAALVSLLASLAARALERDVILALTDAGDLSARRPSVPGRRRSSLGDGHGLTLFLRQQCRHDLKAAVLVDRLGHRVDPDEAPPLLVIGAESEARLANLLASLPPTLPPSAPLLRQELGAAPAADALRGHGVPYLWFSGGRTEWHRGPGDTPERLHRPSLDAAARLLLTVSERLSRTRLPGPAGEHDLSAFRRDAWRRWSSDDAAAPSAPTLRAALRRMSFGEA